VTACLQANEPVADPGEGRQENAVRDLNVPDCEGLGESRLRVASVECRVAAIH
jgi:hypothetical protein